MAKKISESKKSAYASYEKLDKAKVNAERKLQKHLKKHPNDKQASEAVGNVGRTRKNPTTRLGWVDKNLKEALGTTPLRRHITQEYAQATALSQAALRQMQYKPKARAK